MPPVTGRAGELEEEPVADEAPGLDGSGAAEEEVGRAAAVDGEAGGPGEAAEGAEEPVGEQSPVDELDTDEPPQLDETAEIDDEPVELDETAEPGELDETSDFGEETSEADENVDDEAEFADEFPPAMSQMHFVDVLLVLPATHPVIVLQEAEIPYRELRIPIGGPEGIAIGYAARQIATPRPLTHALMTQLLEAFDLTLDSVQITSFERGRFTAELLVSGPTGQRVIDCRPSDAIALALSQSLVVPIMVAPEVLDSAGSGATGAN